VVGGPPTLGFPGFAPQYAAVPPGPYQAPTGFGQQPFNGQPTWVPQGGQPQPPARPAVPAMTARGQDLPRPVIRGLMPDAPAVPPRPAPLAMPSPAQLGLSTAPAGAVDSVDWNRALERVRRLGASGFHLNKVTEGGYLVTLQLPTGSADRLQHIEATAGTEAAAVCLALDRAEQRATGH
jgi:hypothetical protein